MIDNIQYYCTLCHNKITKLSIGKCKVCDREFNKSICPYCLNQLTVFDRFWLCTNLNCPSYENVKTWYCQCEPCDNLIYEIPCSKIVYSMNEYDDPSKGDGTEYKFNFDNVCLHSNHLALSQMRISLQRKESDYLYYISNVYRLNKGEEINELKRSFIKCDFMGQKYNISPCSRRW